MKEVLQLPRKIVLIENDPVLRKLLTQNLELYTGSEIISKRDADELVDFLKREEEAPDLIISENMSGDEYTILKVFYYVNSQKLGIPIILLGENPKLKGQVEQLARTDWPLVVKTAAKMMQVTAESMVEMEMPSYYPVTTALLRDLGSVPIEIFRKVQENFELWREANGKFSNDEVQNLIFDGNQVVFVNALDRLGFVRAVSSHLESKLSSESDVNVLAGLGGDSFNSAATLLGQVGLNEESIRAAKATIDAMEKIAVTSPKLEDLMAILMQNESSIAWRHSVMTAVVCHAMMDKIDWGSQEQKSKLVFASFFHDITIPEDRLAEVHTGGELQQSDLSPEDRVKVERHALAACELLQKHPDVPFGAENIILQHHGMPNGIGFPQDHLDNRITPLAMIFRVAEDYVHQLLSSDKPDSFYVLKGLAIKYNKGQYQKAVEALRAAHPKLMT